MTITLQVGQYGNQVAPAFFSQVYEQSQMSPETDISTFYRYSQKLEKLIPRAVLIDMEPKVVQKCLQLSHLNYLTNQCIYRQSGAGNNWAHGYKIFGNQVIQQIMDVIQHESEYSDKNTSFLTLSSLAGGTGSGLSSFILEQLNDYYPKSSILSQTVLPFQRGEINTQNYNSILSLSKMQQYSNYIIPLANDDAQIIYQKSFTATQQSPGFQQLNSIIGHNLVLNLLHFKDFINNSLYSNSFKLNNLRATPSAPNIVNNATINQVNVTQKQILIQQQQQNLKNMFSTKLFSVLQKISLISVTGSVVDSQLNYAITEKNSTQKYISGFYQIYGKFVNSSKDVSGSDKQRYQQSVQQLQNLCKNQKIFQLQDAKIEQRANFINDLQGNKCYGAAVNLNGLLLKNDINNIQNSLIKQLAKRQFLHIYEQYGIELDDLIQNLQVIEQMVINYESF